MAIAALLVLVGVGALFAARDGARPGAAVPDEGAPVPGSVATPADRGAGTVPAARPAPVAPAAPASRDGDDTESMDRLRALAVGDPRQALALGSDLDRRFPRSPHAEERASLTIDALVKLGDIGQARTNSEEFFERFPRGRFGAHVETLTGVHPRPAPEDEP